jgi:FkbM family methyltransferase
VERKKKAKASQGNKVGVIRRVYKQIVPRAVRRERERLIMARREAVAARAKAAEEKMLVEKAQNTLRFFQQVIQPGWLVFDIGAWKGEYIERALKAGAGHIVAAEPNPALHTKLTERYGHNSRVSIVPKGLADEEGERAFWPVDAASDLSSMATEYIEERAASYATIGITWAEQAMAVPVTTLDRLIEQFGLPSFCKIDVEGYEREVLRGLSQPLPFLSFEFHPHSLQKAADCTAYLDGLGRYEYNFTLMGSMAYNSARWLPSQSLTSLIAQTDESVWYGDIYARLVV